MAKETPHTLKAPISFIKEEISSVIITRKNKFLKGCVVKAGVREGEETVIYMDVGSVYDLAGKMIGYPAEIFDEMDEEDSGFIIGEARDFLLSGLGTGKSGSQ